MHGFRVQLACGGVLKEPPAMGGRERHAYLGISGQVIFFQLRNGNSKLEFPFNNRLAWAHTLDIPTPNSGLLKYEGCRGETALGLSPKGNRGFK